MPAVDLKRLAPGLLHLGWPVPATPAAYASEEVADDNTKKQTKEEGKQKKAKESRRSG